MKKFFRFISALALAVTVVFGSVLPAQAAETITKTYEGGSFFDWQYYADHNPDVVQAVGRDPEALRNHFYTQGVYDKGRDISDLVNLDEYIEKNPDVAQACGYDRLECWRHFEENGIFECRPGVNPDITLATTEVVTTTTKNGQTTTSSSATYFSRDESGKATYYKVEDGATTVIY